LKDQARAAAGKRDSPVKLDQAIKHVTLQLTTSANIESNDLDFEGQLNKREFFDKHPLEREGNIKLTDLLSSAVKQAERDSRFQETNEARKNFTERHGNSVALIGQAGIGKTTLARTIIHLILQKEIFPECDYIFFIQFKDVDFRQRLSFIQLGLASAEGSWDYISRVDRAILEKLNKGEKVAVVMDGLDEANTTAFSQAGPLSPLRGTETPDVFIKHLLSGKLLPKAKKVLTSRPRQFFELATEYRPSFVVLILGLDGSGRSEIIRQLCRAQSSHTFLTNFLGSNNDIASLCAVPALCILISFVMDRDFIETGSGEVLSLTDVFVKVLKYFVGSGHVKGREGDLGKLAAFAWSCLLYGKVVFTESDLRQSGMEQKAMQDFLVTFLSENQCIRILEGDKKTSFSHLTWQELFAAIHCVFFMPPSQFAGIASRLAESKFEMVSKFVFGLFNAKVASRASAILNAVLNDDWQSKRKQAIQLAVNVVKDRKLSNASKLIAISGWLHELKDEAICRQIVSNFPVEVTLQGMILCSDVSSLIYTLTFVNEITVTTSSQTGQYLKFLFKMHCCGVSRISNRLSEVTRFRFLA